MNKNMYTCMYVCGYICEHVCVHYHMRACVFEYKHVCKGEMSLNIKRFSFNTYDCTNNTCLHKKIHVYSMWARNLVFSHSLIAKYVLIIIDKYYS